MNPAGGLGRWGKPTIVGDAVTLRPADERDIAAAWEMVNDEVGNDLTATTESFTFDQIADWYSSRPHQPRRLDLAIIENATGQFAGEVVLTESEAAPSQAGFRISLRGPAWYGRGLGTEATALILRHGFDVMELEQIELEVLERNPRAQHVYEKVGFVETGRFEEEDERWVTMAITPDRAGSG